MDNTKLDSDYYNSYATKKLLLEQEPLDVVRLASEFKTEPVKKYSEMNDIKNIPPALLRDVAKLDRLADYVNSHFTDPKTIKVKDVKRVIDIVEKIIYNRK